MTAAAHPTTGRVAARSAARSRFATSWPCAMTTSGARAARAAASPAAPAGNRKWANTTSGRARRAARTAATASRRYLVGGPPRRATAHTSTSCPSARSSRTSGTRKLPRSGSAVVGHIWVTRRMRSAPAIGPNQSRRAGGGGRAPARRILRPLRQTARVSRRALAFWASAGLLAYAQAGYPVALAALARARGASAPPSRLPAAGEEPDVSLIVAAHAEQEVIAAKVANALELDWPRERLQVVVACDGSPDTTPQRARGAGADVVLELPWGGKVRAQDAAVAAARADLLAFSDANAVWEPGALRALVGRLQADGVGYVCGQVSFAGEGGTNQEGLYWRYEMWIRELESRLASVTGGNGAIYGVRREAYVHVDPVMGHDLSFPFNVVRAGRRAVYEPAARATEKMVPSVEGEWRRKRRMMSHAWPIVLRGGMLDPRGMPPRYAWMIASHRLLRYAGPFAHLTLLGASLRLARRGLPAALALAAQAAVLGGAVVGRRSRSRAALVARYYVLTQASIAMGLVDHLRH